MTDLTRRRLLVWSGNAAVLGMLGGCESFQQSILLRSPVYDTSAADRASNSAAAVEPPTAGSRPELPPLFEVSGPNLVERLRGLRAGGARDVDQFADEDRLDGLPASFEFNPLLLRLGQGVGETAERLRDEVLAVLQRNREDVVVPLEAVERRLRAIQLAPRVVQLLRYPARGAARGKRSPPRRQSSSPAICFSGPGCRSPGRLWRTTTHSKSRLPLGLCRKRIAPGHCTAKRC